MADQELEDYQNLIKSPGFLRWRAAQLTQLQHDMVSWMRHAAADTDDLLALQKLRQVSAMISAVESAFAFPELRIRQLQGIEPQAHAPSGIGAYSRRGTL